MVLNDDFKGIIFTAAIWLIIQTLLFPAILYSPISQFITNNIYSNTFMLLINLPGLLFVIGIILLFLFQKIDFVKKCVNSVIIFLIFYGLIIVLFTGGISKSPLMSLIGIIPLISGPFLPSKTRIITLVFYLFGVIITAFISGLNCFIPPEKYPSGWEHVHNYNNFIIMGLLVVSILLEIGIISLRSKYKIPTP